jgi:hypothetical protein
VIESRSIQGVLIVIVVALLAAWLGVTIVTEQTMTLLKVGGASLLAICLLLGRRIWLLMIFFSALSIPMIRGFSTVELGQALFIGFSLLMFAIRRLRVKANFGELEFWMLMIALTVAQVYLRNPVGLNMFGASAVGARPYFVITLSFVSGWLLSLLVVPENEIRWAARLTLLGTFLGLPVTEWRTRSGYASQGLTTTLERIPWLGNGSAIGLRWLAGKCSPYVALVRPGYLILFLMCVGAAAGSGYRNSVATAGLIILVGIFYHHGIFATIASSVVAALFIGILAAINVVAPLPPNIQRALSPFPGTWERRHITAAENSTEWRVEMWKQALFTDRWIKNKWLGDGLGMTKEEHQRMESLVEGGRESWAGTTGLTIQQENMMLAGGYHSGPVHSIRTVGYVGLAILWTAMFRMTIHMHRLIKRSKGTTWFPVTLFFSIPMLIQPIQFTFVFGEFHTACSTMFFSFGLIRLMTNNLEFSSAREDYRPPADASARFERAQGRERLLARRPS